MDCAKIGRLIARLRKEKGFSQKNMADALNISNKTVSKWECGLGCPDVSLWPELSVILGVDMRQMMEGEITVNRPDSGKIDNIRFYVCPSCQNMLVSTGSSSVFCCGRKLERLTATVAAAAAATADSTAAVTADAHLDMHPDEHPPRLHAELSDGDYYITIDHPMDREHYLLFAAYVKSDKVLITRMYPEQSAAVRLPYMPGGRLYLYCTRHGLTATPVK